MKIEKSDNLNTKREFSKVAILAGQGRSWKECPYSRLEVLQVLYGQKKNRAIEHWLKRYLDGNL